MSNKPTPTVSKAVLTFLAVVVAIGWLVTVIAVLQDAANGGSLLVVTGLLATVVGASFGIQVRRSGGENDGGGGNSGAGPGDGAQ